MTYIALIDNNNCKNRPETQAIPFGKMIATFHTGSK